MYTSTNLSCWRKEPVVSKELVAASSKPLVLGILAEGESYGYDIIRQVKMLSSGALTWTDGMLYPVLHRLEQDGLITARWDTSEAGRRRKYYRLAPSGKEALQRERRQWFAIHKTLARVWGEEYV